MMKKQRILVLFLVGIFVLTGSYILNVDTAYAGETYKVTVTVYDQNGNGIRNAAVTCVETGDEENTNSNGEAEFDLENGDYTFNATKTAYTQTQAGSATVSGAHTNASVFMRRNN